MTPLFDSSHYSHSHRDTAAVSVGPDVAEAVVFLRTS